MQMKKTVLFLICIFLVSGCASNRVSDSKGSVDGGRPPRQVQHLKNPTETTAEETTEAETAVPQTEADATAPVTEMPVFPPESQDTTAAPSEAPTEPMQPAPPPPETPPESASKSPEDILNSMTLEETVGQMFLARHPSSGAVSDIENYRLGGYILFARDFEYETPDSIRAKLSSYQSASKVPMLFAVDEEGGTVTRVSRFTAFRHSPFLSPRELLASGGMYSIQQNEREKARLLKSIGLNVNMAPVCDITTDSSAFMYKRSLGQSPAVTSDFVKTVISEFAEERVGCVMKHFPGYGNNTDTHVGIARDERSKEELLGGDLIPFQAGINAGADSILVSHTIIVSVDPNLPATLSPSVISMLRREMGFGGVIVTDDLSMQAVASIYGSGDAAVMAVLAGNDLLCSTDYKIQYNAVLEAVKSGQIPTETVRSAALRVLNWKKKLGLFD